jgi:3-hydroxyacyl-CoA dehydrogenase
MGMEDQVIPAEKVQSVLRDSVCVVTLSNPPTATLSSEVRAALATEIENAAQNEAIDAIVITGANGAFATGAGVREAESDAPDLARLCQTIEDLEKPVVVAVGGPALGGGLELALASHMRVATADARLGSPEITLGLVPNAGGTQRLPKVIGGVAALKLLLSGRSINGTTAHKIGLVDALSDGDVIETAIKHAKRLAASDGALRRSSSRRDRLGEGTAFLEAVAVHRKAALASALDAPMRMIECIEAALLLPFDIGRGMEQAAYEDLVSSEHSKALRHLFAAERQLHAVTKWTGKVESRPLKGVAVIGARLIGAEVAVLCLDAGYEVVVAEENDEALEDGVARIIELYDARVATGHMSEEDVENVLDRMQAVSGYQFVSDADVVIDPTALLTKKRVASLDAVMKAGAVLVVGGEKVSLGQVAAMTGRSSDVIGMRFFPNVTKNRLIELSTIDGTAPRAIATARRLARKLDRLILETGAGKEAIGTRLAEALHAAADLCLEDGARIGQIDAALRDWGLPYGSFAWRDLQGVNRFTGPRDAEGERGGGLDPVLTSVGRLGISVGRGYYLYRHRGKPGLEDNEVAQMVEADRAAKGISPRALSDGEIRKRCVSAMAGAGVQILAEGIARRPADIDLVAVHGLGFARRTGGVMFAADQLGLDVVRGYLNEQSAVSTRIKEPPPMLLDLIRSKKGFGALNS